MAISLHSRCLSTLVGAAAILSLTACAGGPCTIINHQAEAIVTLEGVIGAVGRVELCSPQGDCEIFDGSHAIEGAGETWSFDIGDHPRPEDVIVRAIGLDESVKAEGETTLDWVWVDDDRGFCGGRMSATSTVVFGPSVSDG